METENKTVGYNVYVTTDYTLFKRLTGNRDISENRISKIVNSIQTVGWIHNPIVVNENMEVIDGQGRLTALQRLNLPVEYVIAPGASTRECIQMNMNMINWKLTDFVNSYAEQGNENYQRLVDLITKYTNLNVISTALYRVSKARLGEIKDGTLILTQEQYENAIPSLEFAKDIYNKLNEKKLPGSIITLMQTLVYYFDYDEIDKTRLAYSVEKYIYNAMPWVSNDDCEREVENIYNYNMKTENKISIAYLLKDERRKRQIELNDANRKRAYARTQKGIQGFITTPSQSSSNITEY